MDLGEYVKQLSAALPFSDAVSLWRSAVGEVRSLNETGLSHPRLKLRSFHIESTGGDLAVRLADDFDSTEDAAAAERMGADAVWPLAAPEQTGLVDGGCDAATNVYNLGVLGYILLTGEAPFNEPIGPKLAEAIVSRPVPGVRIPDVDEPRMSLANRVLARATAKRPEARYQSIAHLEAELSLLLPTTRGEAGGGSLPFVGREDIVRRVSMLLDSARGGTGVRVVLLGEAGIGKTFLWKSVEAAQSRPGERWVYFKAPQTGEIPYAGFAVLLGQLIGSRGESEDLPHRLLAEGISDRATHIAATILPRFGKLHGLSTSEIDSRLESNLDGTEAELAVLVRAIAAPYVLTVIAVDDLQWIDDHTLGVLLELLRHPPNAIMITLLGRPEAKDRIPADLPIEQISLPGLNEQESLALLERILSTDGRSSDISELNERIQKQARGNPLATVNLLQLLRVDRRNAPSGLETDAPMGDGANAHANLAEHEMLEGLARSRMENVSRACQRFVRYLSLLLPPVPFEMIGIEPATDATATWTLLNESEAALLLSVDQTRKMVWFFHDSIESIARREALSDPKLVERAARALFAASQRGSVRASFALARLLAPSDPSSGVTPRNDADGIVGPPNVGSLHEYLGSEDAIRILQRASARALELMIPADALRFAEAALAMIAENTGGASADEGLQLALHRIAHEAAYLSDDAHGMSRHFLRIRSLGGPLDRNEARQRWIARTYAKARFASALQIGWIVLRELEAIPEDMDKEQVERRAQRFLRRANPASTLRRLCRVPVSRDRRASLIVLTCIRVLLPALTVDRKQLSVLVHLIIRESLANGTTGFSGIAFVCWGLLQVTATGAARFNWKMLEYALQMSSRTDDAIGRHTIRSYVGILIGMSHRSYTEILSELPGLYQEGVKLGNLEFAAHALHIHAQGLLYHGRPLGEVFTVMGEYREKIGALNYDRTSRALAKFQQAAECLAGKTPNPLELTGSICTEDEYRERNERDDDVLSMAGFHLLKAMLALFNDEPELAAKHAPLSGPHTAAAAGLYDDFVGHFLWGMAAFRTGRIAEGCEALRRFRYWMRHVRETHEHRYLAIRAEQAAAQGSARVAIRRFAGARELALSRGFPHEAALFAEREADLMRLDPRTAPRAREPLHLAHSLYSQWGALPAVERVRRKLNWREHPIPFEQVLTDESFLNRITTAPSEEIFGQTVLEQVSRFTAARESFLSVEIAGSRSLFGKRADESPRVEANASLPDSDTGDLVEWLENAQEGLRLIDDVASSSGGRRALLTCRIDPSPSISVRVCLAGAPGVLPFSSVVRSRVSATVLLSASILQLREAVFTEVRQTAALRLTQQELARTQNYSRVLFSTLPDALLLVDANPKVLFHNRAAERFMSRNGSTAVGFEREVRGIVQRALRHAEHHPEAQEVEAPWHDSILSVLAICPDFSRGLEPRQIFAVTIRDVTAVRRQDEELRRKEQQLIIADRMASIGMFSSAIAHEVSNPNHILKLNAQSLSMLLESWQRETPASHVPLIDEAREIVEKIAEGTRRIEGVVDQVKQYGREGRSEEWESVDPNEICERALRFSRIMATNYTNNLVFGPRRDGPPIFAIRGQLEQAIINLIKNACEALESVDGVVRVGVEYDAEKRKAFISVSDTGPGIDPSVTEMPGLPFSTTRAAQGGTGLGLSIVRTIVDRHGGEFHFLSSKEFTTIARLGFPTMRREETEGGNRSEDMVLGQHTAD